MKVGGVVTGGIPPAAKVPRAGETSPADEEIPDDEAAAEPEPASLDIVYSEVKDRLDVQLHQIDSLDSKAGLILFIAKHRARSRRGGTVGNRGTRQQRLGVAGLQHSLPVFHGLGDLCRPWLDGASLFPRPGTEAAQGPLPVTRERVHPAKAVDALHRLLRVERADNKAESGRSADRADPLADGGRFPGTGTAGTTVGQPGGVRGGNGRAGEGEGNRGIGGE